MASGVPRRAFILSRGDGVHAYAIDATHRRFPAAQGLRHGPVIQRVIVRSFANKLCTVAPDVCSPDSVREACDKARLLDPRCQATRDQYDDVRRTPRRRRRGDLYLNVDD